MSSFPCLVRVVSGSGEVRYRLGERLVDRYLEFVAGRCRPNTLRAVAFDLKAFFVVTGQDPVAVTAADVFEFLADQRGDRTAVRLADRESGLSARTIARRLSSVSGLYAYLVARGDTPGGRVEAVADRAAGAGAADATAGLVPSGGGPAGRRAAHAPGPGDGAGDAAGRAAPVRGAGAAVRRRAGRRPAAGRGGGQGRPSPGGPGGEPVLRRARRVP